MKAAPRVSAALGTAGLLACLGLCACSDGVAPQRVELGTRVSSSPAVPFENSLGWTVHLESAWLSIGSLLLLEGEALASHSATHPAAPGPEPWWQSLFLKTAHAHPGHYQEGSVFSEMLSPVSVELLSPTNVAASRAITGQPGSGKIVFADPPPGPFARELDGAVIRVIGRAEQGGGEVRHFTAFADASDLAEVAGCPLEGGPLTFGQTLSLEVDRALWFDQVDFAGLEPSSAQDPTQLAQDPRAHHGFLRGIAKAAAYRFHLISQ